MSRRRFIFYAVDILTSTNPNTYYVQIADFLIFLKIFFIDCE